MLIHAGARLGACEIRPLGAGGMVDKARDTMLVAGRSDIRVNGWNEMVEAG